jgi:hypothetical protein
MLGYYHGLRRGRLIAPMGGATDIPLLYAFLAPLLGAINRPLRSRISDVYVKFH